MCDYSPNREAAMVVVRHDDNNIPTVWCDPCLAPLVEALQPIGTVASCCGHGNSFGNIALADGRELMILPDFESARRAERLVRLDVDVEALREALSQASSQWSINYEKSMVILRVARQVLAALDGETT